MSVRELIMIDLFVSFCGMEFTISIMFGNVVTWSRNSFLMAFIEYNFVIVLYRSTSTTFKLYLTKIVHMAKLNCELAFAYVYV